MKADLADEVAAPTEGFPRGYPAMSEETKRSALSLFERLQAEFPHLEMRINHDDPELELAVEILRQPGLTLDVYLNLQNEDELHLCVGRFWGSWFPSTKLKVVQEYRDAVAGVLSGRNRIVEYVRWGRVPGADLQAPAGSDWKTGYRSQSGLLPPSWGSTKRVIRNERAG